MRTECSNLFHTASGYSRGKNILQSLLPDQFALRIGTVSWRMMWSSFSPKGCHSFIPSPLRKLRSFLLVIQCKSLHQLPTRVPTGHFCQALVTPERHLLSVSDEKLRGGILGESSIFTEAHLPSFMRTVKGEAALKWRVRESMKRWVVPELGFIKEAWSRDMKRRHSRHETLKEGGNTVYSRCWRNSVAGAEAARGASWEVTLQRWERGRSSRV